MVYRIQQNHRSRMNVDLDLLAPHQEIAQREQPSGRSTYKTITLRTEQQGMKARSITHFTSTAPGEKEMDLRNVN
jgi:hypothetical protein